MPESQVRRDVLISHVLHALPEACDDLEVVFFGGTALARTHLTGFRLSEDIDLLTTVPGELLYRIRRGLPRLLRRRYPDLAITDRRSRETVTADLSDGVDVVRVQAVLLDAEAVAIARRAATALPPHVFNDSRLPTQQAWTASSRPDLGLPRRPSPGRGPLRLASGRGVAREQP